MKRKPYKKQSENMQKHNMLINTPIPILIKSMEVQLDILRSKGVEIRDFDNKSKVVKQIRMIGNQVYFLSVDDTEKDES